MNFALFAIVVTFVVVVVSMLLARVKTRQVVTRTTVSMVPPPGGAVAAAAIAAAGAPPTDGVHMNPAIVVQWVLKAGLFLVAVVLTLTHQLTSESAELLSAGFIALGATNAATILGLSRIVAAAASTAQDALGALHRANAAAGITTTTTTTTTPSVAPPPLAGDPGAGDVPRDPFLPPVAAVALALLLAAGASSACGSALTPVDGILVGSEGDEQSACTRAYAGNREQTDACRARVRAAWDAHWRSQFDGGTDGQVSP